MAFRESFEKHVNEELSNSPSSSKPSLKINTETQTHGLKKRLSTIQTPDLEADHHDFNEKHDRPPRFSTLYGVTPALPPRNAIHSPVFASRRQKGILVPTPVFILLIGLVVFEGLALFAYTALGLYGNFSSHLMPVCQDKAGVNISPNIIIGSPAQPNLVLPTPAFHAALPLPTTSLPLSAGSTTTSSASISTTAPATTTVDSAIADSQVASSAALDVLKIFAGMNGQADSSSSSSGMLTVHSTVVVTVDPPSLTPQSTVVVWVRSDSAGAFPTDAPVQNVVRRQGRTLPRRTDVPVVSP